MSKAGKSQKPVKSSGSKHVREAAMSYAAEQASMEAEPVRRKNLRLHQSKIDEARELLGTSTETETIETALDLVVFRAELATGIRAMQGAALEDVFGTGTK